MPGPDVIRHDLIQFYNKVYVPQMKSFGFKFNPSSSHKRFRVFLLKPKCTCLFVCLLMQLMMREIYSIGFKQIIFLVVELQEYAVVSVYFDQNAKKSDYDFYMFLVGLN